MYETAADDEVRQQRCCMSTISPKYRRKSSPRIGYCASVMMKIHGSECLRPRLSERFLHVQSEPRWKDGGQGSECDEVVRCYDGEIALSQ